MGDVRGALQSIAEFLAQLGPRNGIIFAVGAAVILSWLIHRLTSH
jgi:hypothetical protein